MTRAHRIALAERPGFGSAAHHTLGRKIMAQPIGAIFERYRSSAAGL